MTDEILSLRGQVLELKTRLAMAADDAAALENEGYRRGVRYSADLINSLLARVGEHMADAKRFQWLDRNARQGEGTDAWPFQIHFVVPSRLGVNLRKAIDEAAKNE
jgi:hypothetical protein